jgi:hypothetical protein
VAFHLVLGESEQLGVIDTEDTENLGLVFEVVEERLPETGDFRVVKAKRFRFVAGYVPAVEHLEVHFRSLVKARDVDEDLVSFGWSPDAFAKEIAELNLL